MRDIEIDPNEKAAMEMWNTFSTDMNKIFLVASELLIFPPWMPYESEESYLDIFQRFPVL